MYNKGFTLIEMTLYVSFTVVGLLVAGMFTLDVLNAKATLLSMNAIAQSASFSMEHIAREVRSADAVTLPAASSTEDSLVIHDAEQNQEVTFTTVGTQLFRNTASSSIALTPANVILSDLRFENVGYSGASGAVRISFTLGTPSSTGYLSSDYHESFVTTAALRSQP